MRRLYLCLAAVVALCAVAACSRAQTEARTYSLSGDYDFKHHKVETYALLPSNMVYDLGNVTAGIPDVPHFHFELDLAPWAGAGELGRGAIGYQATHNFTVTKDGKWVLVVGFDGAFEQGRVPQFAKFIAGVTVKIGK